MLAEELRRMEALGQVRRGYYLAGLSGLQFAVPEAVDALRQAAKKPEWDGPRSGSPRLVSLLDPACAYGVLYPIPGPGGARMTIPRLSGSYLVLWGGEPVLGVEGYGRVLIPLTPLSREELQEALRTLSRLVLPDAGGPRPRSRLTVERWGEELAVRASVADVLEELGYQRDPDGYVLWGYRAEQQR
jgi:ATP-dependent Lhr-like helicase